MREYIRDKIKFFLIITNIESKGKKEEAEIRKEHAVSASSALLVTRISSDL